MDHWLWFEVFQALQIISLLHIVKTLSTVKMKDTTLLQGRCLAYLSQLLTSITVTYQARNSTKKTFPWKEDKCMLWGVFKGYSDNWSKNALHSNLSSAPKKFDRSGCILMVAYPIHISDTFLTQNIVSKFPII